MEEHEEPKRKKSHVIMDAHAHVFIWNETPVHICIRTIKSSGGESRQHIDTMTVDVNTGYLCLVAR